MAWSVFDRRRGKHWYTNESKYTAQYYANLYSHRESDGNPSMVVTPLYTAPPKREWVGLTDDDKREFAAAQYGWEDLLAAADAKLKEKNA